MKRYRKNGLCMLCIGLLLCGCLVSCGTETSPQNGTSTPMSGSTETVTTEEKQPIELVPISNMGGKEFCIMTTNWYNHAPLDFTDIAPTEQTSDLISNAAYERVLYMEEAYNCYVSRIDVDTGSVTSALAKNTLGGDKTYDFVYLRGTNLISAITGGHLAETSSFEMDFAAPWWDAEGIASLSINNRTYALIGDVSVNHLLATWMGCFNKELVEDHGLENPYDMVKQGSWTFENVIRMSKQIATDNDGTPGMGPNDLWGLDYSRDTVMGILSSCGIKIVEKNADGVPEMVIGKYQAEVQSLLEQLYDRTHTRDRLNFSGSASVFETGHALVLFAAAQNAPTLRFLDVDYGIVPYPKASEESEYISTPAGLYLSLLTIPVTNTNYETSALFLDAFAAYGYQEVRPVFYDNILLRKVGKDEESFEMLQYIFENIFYDIGTIYDITDRQIQDTARTYNSSFVTLYANAGNVWKTKLENLLTKFS
ncbi:MAG: hypothetical protein IJX28_02360 [Clostridia bacterium]|nr:hypothetical protein [Clostridia bacterium]